VAECTEKSRPMLVGNLLWWLINQQQGTLKIGLGMMLIQHATPLRHSSRFSLDSTKWMQYAHAACSCQLLCSHGTIHPMILFNGHVAAQWREETVRARVSTSGAVVRITALLFEEDAGSRLYTRLKREAAERVGIEYAVRTFAMQSDTSEVRAALAKLNADVSLTGIIIQKPTRVVWQQVVGETTLTFPQWWRQLVSEIAVEKDVDGLHPESMNAIKVGLWRERGMVLPATCQAVMDILLQAVLSREHTDRYTRNDSENMAFALKDQKVLIIGKSDLLGNPLFYELKNIKVSVELVTRRQFRERVESGNGLRDAAVVVSATGQRGLITGELLADDSIVIDVGEPRGDVDRMSVLSKVQFLTPVPGGVGPLTVQCLLENAVELARSER